MEIFEVILINAARSVIRATDGTFSLPYPSIYEKDIMPRPPLKINVAERTAALLVRSIYPGNTLSGLPAPPRHGATF